MWVGTGTGRSFVLVPDPTPAQARPYGWILFWDGGIPCVPGNESRSGPTPPMTLHNDEEQSTDRRIAYLINGEC